MPAITRARRTRSISQRRIHQDPVTQANLSLPPIVPIREFKRTAASTSRDYTTFGVPLFHLNGRRDRDNTVAWWPFDVSGSVNLELGGSNPDISEELRKCRMLLNNNTQIGWNEGEDDNFRLCDVNGPRLIRLADHCPGGRSWCSLHEPWDRSGQVLSATENPLEGVNVAALSIWSNAARNIDDPALPLPSSIFARCNSNNTTPPLPSLEHFLGILANVRTEARGLLRSPGPRTMREHATLRNAFRDVLVTLARAPRPPSKSTIELVDLTALIVADSLLKLIGHPNILRSDTPLPET
jgi:hypothetical protein